MSPLFSEANKYDNTATAPSCDSRQYIGGSATTNAALLHRDIHRARSTTNLFCDTLIVDLFLNTEMTTPQPICGSPPPQARSVSSREVDRMRNT